MVQRKRRETEYGAGVRTGRRKGGKLEKEANKELFVDEEWRYDV